MIADKKEPWQTLLWLDLETTGLDACAHHIVEVGAIITDHLGNEKRRFHCVTRPFDDMSTMMWHPYTAKMHAESGLISELLKGEGVVSLDAAMAALLEITKEHAEPKCITLAGRTVHFDRGFIRINAPDLEAYLHHRHMDVSTVEMFLRNAGCNVKEPESKGRHRSIADLEYSITQYKQFLDVADHHLRGAEF